MKFKPITMYGTRHAAFIHANMVHVLWWTQIIIWFLFSSKSLWGVADIQGIHILFKLSLLEYLWITEYPKRSWTFRVIMTVLTSWRCLEWLRAKFKSSGIFLTFGNHALNWWHWVFCILWIPVLLLLLPV